MEIKLFVATKAFIFNKGKVLIVLESDNHIDGSSRRI